MNCFGIKAAMSLASCGSGSDSLGVSGEEGALPNVVEVAVELDDSFEAEAGSSVGGGSVLEGVDVVLNGVDGDAEVLGSLGEHLGVVDSLGSAGDLLSPHEEVVRVGVVGVGGVQHRVEGAHGRGVAVEHVEVGVVLLPHQLAQGLLSLGGEVVEGLLVDAGVLQHLHSLLEVDLEHGGLALEVLEGVLLLDDVQLLLVPGLQALEDVDEQVGEHVEHLEVVLLDRHLHIEARELAQMPVRVGVLGPEHGSDLEDAVEVGAESHLLVELGALGEAGLLAEVLELENVGPALGGPSDHLGGVDLDEVVLDHELSVELADAGLDLEDGLVRGHSQVDDAVVEPDVLLDDDLLLLRAVLGFLLGLLAALLGCLVGDKPARILELEGEDGRRLVDHPELLHLDLDLLAAGLDGHLGHDDLALDLDDRLAGHLAGILHHALADRVVLSQDALDGRELLPHDDEAELALGPRVLKPAPHDDLLALEGLVDVHNLGELLGEPDLGVALGPDQLAVAEEMRRGVVLVLDIALVLVLDLVLSGGESLSLLGLPVVLLLLLLLDGEVTQLDLLLGEDVPVGLLGLEVVLVAHGHGVRPEAAVEVNLGLLAQTPVDPHGHSKNFSEGRDGSWQASGGVEDLLGGGESEALAADDFLELLRRESLRGTEDGQVEGRSLQGQLLACIFEEHGLGSCLEGHVPDLGGLLA
uniref:Uncharacterized protein n=1 Tax=Strombidium rassoulzadegani TaxID=1082188 RepID=A0A7S3CR00_9SPIT|mmetsp:Transcript_4373/g.7390  ORF Transcript_4373/g.7390 Transcript_4373/m.7390 type:complete len:696 (+) Transcript_4373:56-2143(+)